jgi:hypothetical protein
MSGDRGNCGSYCGPLPLRAGILEACWRRKFDVHCPSHRTVELDTAGQHAGADGVYFLASLLLGTLEAQERSGVQRGAA